MIFLKLLKTEWFKEEKTKNNFSVAILKKSKLQIIKLI